MLFSVRRFAPVLLVACLGLVAGCGSNNKGKIEGKWKVNSMPGMEEKELKMMETMKAYGFMEFTPDGAMRIGVESADPQVQMLLAGAGDKTVLSCKYKLGSGDSVEFYDLPKEMQEKGGGLFGKNKDRAKTSVKISGDNMTLTDPDGKTGTLTRVK